MHVRYDAVLTSPDAGLIGARSFSAETPIAVQTGPAVAAGLSDAANRLAADVADWVRSSGG